MIETPGRLTELLTNLVESAITGGFTSQEIIKALHADEINAAITRATARRKAVMDGMRERILNRPREVPKAQWTALLDLLSTLTPIKSNSGTHCYDNHYELDGKTYIVTHQYGFDVPVDICVKD